MFKEKYGVGPQTLSFWLGLYLMTAVPAYIILYEANIMYCIGVLILENIVTYYLSEDFIDEVIDNLGKWGIIFFLIGTLVGFISLGVLMFYNLKLFILLVISEIIFIVIKKFI